VRTVTYERSGPTNTGAQALRLEDARHLKVLEQGEIITERDLSPDEARKLGPLVEAAGQGPVPPVEVPQPAGPEGLAVSLAFEDEELPRVRLAAVKLPARGAGGPYDALLAELDAMLTSELHARAPRHAHTVWPHELRDEE